ncbi:MAG: 6,7-dimethyl-8-ribityllumazine synthase [Steroidobacteraceae bacterium]
MARSDGIAALELLQRGAGLKIGVVMSRFNAEVSGRLLSSCTATLLKHGVAADKIVVVTVPGALEAPFALQQMAQSENYDALIALGAVIRGETYHFEIVANESARGIMSVQLGCGVPIANGILTTENEGQALARVLEKGADSALAAIEMANLSKHLRAG